MFGHEIPRRSVKSVMQSVIGNKRGVNVDPAGFLLEENEHVAMLSDVLSRPRTDELCDCCMELVAWNLTVSQ